MEGLSTKVEQSVTSVKYETKVSYDTGKSGAWKTWHGRPHASAKGGINKVGGYTSAYSKGTDRNKTDER